MFSILKKRMPNEFVEHIELRIRMTAALCETFISEKTLSSFNPRLTPIFDNEESFAKLLEAFDYFDQHSQMLVNLLPSEKRDEMESFVSEFSQNEDDPESAYYIIASLLLLYMVHFESIILLKDTFRPNTHLWDRFHTTGKALSDTYFYLTRGHSSSAPKIVPRFFDEFA